MQIPKQKTKTTNERSGETNWQRQKDKTKIENKTQEAKKGKGNGKGKGKGKSYQRNLGDRKPAGDGVEKKSDICHNWARGNGYCKYGPS